MGESRGRHELKHYKNYADVLQLRSRLPFVCSRDTRRFHSHRRTEKNYLIGYGGFSFLILEIAKSILLAVVESHHHIGLPLCIKQSELIKQLMLGVIFTSNNCALRTIHVV